MSAAKAQPLPGAPDARLAGAERITRLIHRANSAGRRLRRLLAEYVAQWNLGDNEFLVLWLCGSRPYQGLGQGELAAAIGVSPAQMSSLVERLRQRGMIAVERSTGDRRRQVWQAAAPGQELLAEVRVGLEVLASRLDRQIAPAMQATAEDLFDRLAQLADDESPLHIFDPHARATAQDDSERGVAHE